MNPLLSLDRHLSRALETGRGIRLSPEEVDLVCATGAYDAIHRAAEPELRNQAKCRNAQRRRQSNTVADTRSTGHERPTPRHAPHSPPSSGTTPRDRQGGEYGTGV